MARHLLYPHRVWFSLAGAASDGARLEQILPRLEALAQFAGELDARLRAAGVDGVDGALDLDRRLRAVLDTFSRDEIGRVAEAAVVLRRGLDAVLEGLDRVARLKAQLDD